MQPRLRLLDVGRILQLMEDSTFNLVWKSTLAERNAIHGLEPYDYEKRFSLRKIYIGTRQQNVGQRLPLFQRVLGQARENLAPEIRQLDAVEAISSFVGQCSVQRGRNPLVWFIAAICGLPKAGADQYITVTLRAECRGRRRTLGPLH